MAALDLVGGRADETLATFSLGVAREEAWLSAGLLAERPQSAWPALVTSLDRRTAILGRSIAEPGFPFDLALRTVRLLESSDVRAIIDALEVFELE
jgi:hypothetical protein